MVCTITKRVAPRLRADATRNRERIVAAAQEAFIELGPDVPLDEIARRAGIGNATLYRHFKDRRELTRSVVLDVMDRIAAEAEAMIAGAADAPDAFTALAQFVHGTADWKVGALCPLLAEWMDLADPEVVAARDRLDRLVDSIIEMSQAEGSLRDDVSSADIMIVVSQLARPLPGADPAEHSSFVHRYLQILLDGLRAPKRSALPGRPATLQDLRQGHEVRTAH
jgi:AcrR family transcriptional regulator